MSDDCPCDTGEPFAGCCGPILDGVPAPTALALMRSRYTAFVRKDFAYLVATHDPATLGKTNARDLERATSRTVWLGLEIVTTAAGGEADDTGVVEFIARGSSIEPRRDSAALPAGGEPPPSYGKSFAQRERSRFRRVAGRWVYSDGDIT